MDWRVTEGTNDFIHCLGLRFSAGDPVIDSHFSYGGCHYDAESQEGFHVGVTLGGDLHHRRSDRIVVARSSTGSRSRTSCDLRQQPEAVGSGDAELRVDLQGTAPIRLGR